MRKVIAVLLSAALIGVGLVASRAPAALAATPTGPATTEPVRHAEPVGHAESVGHADDLIGGPQRERRALRGQAVADVLSGRARTQQRNGSTVVKVTEAPGSGTPSPRAAAGTGRYVELAREATDRVFVILAEFGDERHPLYPDRDTDPHTPGPVTFDGPRHNTIAKPDPAKDNITGWLPDYSPDYFRELYFGTGEGVESLKTYLETQSSGRYSISGTVTDWVKVRYNEARYGRSGDDPADANGDDPHVCDSFICGNAAQLVVDAANQWMADQLAAGRSEAQVAEDLRSFDRHDRYDFDSDGDFNEADGYLDHTQVVFAGNDEADLNVDQGEDALWSHRGYVDTGAGGGPGTNKAGGTQIGDTGVWVGDYTMQAENGGLSTVAHEYLHDLDLPDDATGSATVQNSTGYWTVMGQPRLSAPGDIGWATRAGDLGAWNKLQLGWLDYETVVAGRSRTLDLGPEEYNTDEPQAVVVVLPRKTVTTDGPYAGAGQFFSGDADGLDTAMTRRVDLAGATAAHLTFKARYAIERGWDFFSVEASTDGGTTWAPLAGTVGGAPFAVDDAGAPAVTGSSNGAWADVAVPLDAYVGGEALVRLRYRTDEGVAEGGLYADAVSLVVDGREVSTDGAEAGPSAWTLAGFSRMGPRLTKEYGRFYIAAHRSHVSYDKYLATGPSYAGYAGTRPRFVDHYPYSEGLLISYWDTEQTDNDTGAHVGAGRNLYIDAHPAPLYNLTGTPWHSRLQTYDAPFSLRRAPSFTLHVAGKPSYVRGQAAVPTFDDTDDYLHEEIPYNGVTLPAVGVRITVLRQNGTAMRVRISAKAGTAAPVRAGLSPPG